MHHQFYSSLKLIDHQSLFAISDFTVLAISILIQLAWFSCKFKSIGKWNAYSGLSNRKLRWLKGAPKKQKVIKRILKEWVLWLVCCVEQEGQAGLNTCKKGKSHLFGLGIRLEIIGFPSMLLYFLKLFGQITFAITFLQRLVPIDTEDLGNKILIGFEMKKNTYPEKRGKQQREQHQYGKCLFQMVLYSRRKSNKPRFQNSTLLH